MSRLTFPCPACRIHISSAAPAGATIVCPRCNGRVTVPKDYNPRQRPAPLPDIETDDDTPGLTAHLRGPARQRDNTRWALTILKTVGVVLILAYYTVLILGCAAAATTASLAVSPPSVRWFYFAGVVGAMLFGVLLWAILQSVVGTLSLICDIHEAALSRRPRE